MNYKYAISKVKDGNMSFKWGDPVSVPENRRKFLSSNGFNIEQCVTVHTTNGTLCRRVTSKDAGLGMFDVENALQADAMITDEPDLGLFLLVADCAATVFYDPTKKVLCLAHINGMNPEIITSVIDAFSHDFESKLADLEVKVSPAIHKASFVVPDSFQRESAEWEPYVVNLDEHLSSIDMLGFLKAKMIKIGILETNISVSDVDTYTSSDYFSHRRSAVSGETEGRFAVATKII